MLSSGGSVSVDIDPKSSLIGLMHPWQLQVTKPVNWSDVVESLGPTHGLSRYACSNLNTFIFELVKTGIILLLQIYN